MRPRKSLAQNQPLVSIILCTFNRAHLVTRAISSVLIQTHRNWELIVVDDGSADETAQLVLPIVKSDLRISYIYHANKGLALSRNAGMRFAEGQYITFLDSDDEYREDHLAVRVRIMEKRSSPALLYGGIEYVGPPEKQYVPDARHPGRKIHLSNCYASGTFFARASVFKKLVGFRNIPFAEDFDLVQRMRTKGFKLVKVKEPTYRYHVDTDNRLCDLYERGGEQAILEYRNAARSVTGSSGRSSSGGNV